MKNPKIGLFSLAVLIAAFVVSGCQMFDLNGDGKFDPVAYVNDLDVSVVLTDENGQTYEAAVDEIGMKILGTYIQSKTGYLFEVAEDGAITVTDPAGVKIQLKPKARE